MVALEKAWHVTFVGKLLVLIAVIVAGLSGGSNLSQFMSASARWADIEKAEQPSPVAAWDGSHYLLLSQRGYRAGSPSCAFYPLWPMLIRAGGVLTGNRPLLASLLLANGLSLAAFWLFYRLVERHVGRAVGRDALILMLAFPGALFFSFPYTESLYLLLVVVFFWALELERWVWVALAACLLPLARPVGIFIALPLAWYLWRGQGEAGRTSDHSPPKPEPKGLNELSELHGLREERHGRSALPGLEQVGASHSGGAVPGRACGKGGSLWRWVLLLCPLLGYAAYFGLMCVWTGNAFEGFDAQRSYPNSPSIRNMFDYAGLASGLLNFQTFDGMTDGLLDRVLFLLFLALLPLVYRLNRAWFFYTLACGLVPALTSWFISYRRYFMVLFPVFIVLAQLLQKTGRRWIFWYYVVLLAAMQAWAVLRFVSFKWAG